MSVTKVKKNYYLTFGQKYYREPHPWFSKAHPSGLVQVRAYDYASAREYVIGRIGSLWSDLYEASAEQSTLDVAELYPLGVLEVWDATVVAGRRSSRG